MDAELSGLLEVANFEGEGYRPLIIYGAWRVAVLRYLDELEPSCIERMERHLATDEVFILTHGRAMLVLGGNDRGLGTLRYFPMRVNEVCNVKANVWHAVIVTQDVHLIIVENDDTSVENTEYSQFSESSKREFFQSAIDFLGDNPAF